MQPIKWQRMRVAGDSALLLEFGESVDSKISRAVQETARAVQDAAIDGVWGCVPAFTTLLIEFDPSKTTVQAVQTQLESLVIDRIDSTNRMFVVPVCYGGVFGEDLVEVAQKLHLTPDEVVRRHSGVPYYIYCLGFAPGFPLCGLLPKALQLARRESPRVRVPAGSVAIAGAQTGVYPLESPGGWHLLGRTPARLFQWDRDPMVRLRPGDWITFRAIDTDEYDRLAAQVDAGGDGLTERAYA
jgi:inhibitor of KinA